MKSDTLILNEKKHVSLTCYIHDDSPEYGGNKYRPAILVLPGGGYSFCSDREAEPVALAYAGAGYNAFVLRYTLKTVEGWPAQLNDYEHAMETIKRRAEEWCTDIDRIAVAGFSAGGHLAACAATIAKNKPTAAILGYAALRKETVAICGKSFPCPIDLVDGDTAPCFLFGTRNDNVAYVQNTIEFTSKLVQNGISFESHIYSYGPHGFSTGSRQLNSAPITDRARNWINDSLGWLEELWGARTFTGYTEPTCEKRVNADAGHYLSADCTYAYLLAQGNEALQAMETIIEKFEAKRKTFSSDILMDVIGQWKLSDLTPALGFTAQEIENADIRLKNIVNKK